MISNHTNLRSCIIEPPSQTGSELFLFFRKGLPDPGSPALSPVQEVSDCRHVVMRFQQAVEVAKSINAAASAYTSELRCETGVQSVAGVQDAIGVLLDGLPVDRVVVGQHDHQ